jgi:hypothetical protein
VAGLTPRRNHGAAAVLRGAQSRVFIIGGQDAGGTVLDTVDEYLAQAIIVQASPTHTALPSPRARFGIGSTLSSNQIYVAGGVDGSGAEQTTIFEYTVSNNGAVPGVLGTPSGAWVTRGNLPNPLRDLRLSTPPGVTNLEPVENTGRDPRQDSIAAFVALGIRSSHAPVPSADASARRGRLLFGQSGLVVAGFSCATCHGGPKWTRSAVDYTTPPSPEIGIGLGNERVIGAELRQTKTQPNSNFPGPSTFPGVLLNVNTFNATGRSNELRVNSADPGQAIAPLGPNGFDIPSLLSVAETAPYYYSGLAQTLDQVLDGSQDGNGSPAGTRHHFVADPTKRADLVQFLRSIDPATPPFP